MNTPQPVHSSPTQRRLHLRSALWRWLRRILLTCLALILIGVATFFIILPPRGIYLTDSWQFKEKHDGPAIGNLGGVPVRIPTEFAHFVEYDADPGFLEPRKGPVPERTQQSRLRSFGFDVLYPEMLGLTQQTQSMGYHDNIYLSMWVDVSINSGERDYGAKALSNLEKSMDEPQWWKFPLKKTQALFHGLTVFESQGGDPKDNRHVTVYTHHNQAGDIDAYIDCYDTPHPAAPCTLEADMRPDMNANLRIGFRRGLVPQWADILKNVKTKILSFKHTP
jgi:hypothetical protein